MFENSDIKTFPSEINDFYLLEYYSVEEIVNNASNLDACALILFHVLVVIK